MLQWPQGQVSVQNSPLRKASKFLYCPLSLLDVNPSGCQSQIFWGLISPLQVRHWGACYGAQTHLFIKENLFLRCLSIIGCHIRDGVFDEAASVHLLPVSVSLYHLLQKKKFYS